MKKLAGLLLLLIAVGCSAEQAAEETEVAKPEVQEVSTADQDRQARLAQSIPPDFPAESGADKVPHYACPDGCEGGGGNAAGSCSVCGKELTHNQVYHLATGEQVPQQLNVQPQPEAAQNASGVWHFTCSKGCEGGAGAAAACATCGSPLAHNQAYHQ